MPGPPSPLPVRLALVAGCWCALLPSASVCRAAEVDEAFEGGRPLWGIAESDCSPRVASHSIATVAARRGESGERIVIDASTGSMLRVQFPVGPASLIDEFRGSVWVRANRAGVRFGVRVRLPDMISRQAGRPIDTVVFGTASRDPDRWERLEVDGIVNRLERQQAPLRAQYGSAGTLAGAVVTHVVLELYSAPGHYELAIDDLR